MSEVQTLTINIRPESNVYATYRRIAYKAWYAIGEFVDNSTQNFYDHRDEIEREKEGPATLEIDVVYDSHAGTLTVIDNANGMGFEELQRAVQLNRPPDNRSGRSEFGMGLKMAACWFGSRWRVVTKRLSSSVEYEAVVDIGDLETYRPQTIDVLERSGVDPLLHYTRIEIEQLHKTFHHKTISRIKEHLSSMYRRDIESGRVIVRWNGEPLVWKSDPIFEEVRDGQRIIWKKPVNFEVEGLPVTGFVWIRMPGDARRAGMHLFRRNRVVIGGPGEGYKPEEIFGAPNSFQSQRLVGELNLDNWPVTQTKDDFDWAGDLEHKFITKLKEKIDDYIEEAREARAPAPGRKPTKADAQLAGDVTKSTLADPAVETAMLIVEQGPPITELTADQEIERVTTATRGAGEPTYVAVGNRGLPTMKVWWTDEMAASDVYAEFASPTDDELWLTVNLNHPFVVHVVGRDPERLAFWAQMLYVDALVERGARKRGDCIPPSAFRIFKDQFLRNIQPSTGER